MLPLTLWGRVSSDSSCLASISKQQLRIVNYSQFGDALRRTTSFVPLSHGSMGQPDGVEICGIMPGGITMMVNGRPFQDTWSPIYDPLRFAPNAIERIEVLAGSDAIGSSPELSFVAMNMQRIIYNSARPHISMWYHQGAGDLVSGSVAYAQNISERASIAGTIRRSGARGVYVSTDFDAWNVHLQSRYQLNRYSQLLLNYDVVSSATDAWGGVADDPLGTSQLVETLPTKYTTFRDNQRRHDIEVSHCADVIGDSSVRIMTTAYGIVDARQRVDTTARGTHAGITSRLDYTAKGLAVNAGARLEQVNADTLFGSAVPSIFQSNVWTKGTVNITTKVACSLSGQLQSADQSQYGLGGSVRYTDSTWRFLLDASTISGQLPYRSGTMLIGELKWHSDEGAINAILYHYQPKVSGAAKGFIISGSTRYSSLEITPTLRLISRPTSSTSKVMLYGDVAVSYLLRTESSDVRLGARITVQTSGILPQYDPIRWNYNLDGVQAPFQHNGIDLFASVQVGTASIRASFENLLGNRWYSVAYLPEVPRQFRLSVDWTFVD